MKRAVALFLVFILMVPLLAGCKKSEDDIPEFSSNEIQLKGPSVGDTIAVFETDLGIFKAVLYSQQAPDAVNNFVTLANNNYYNGSTFHRVIASFVVQGGDPTGTGSGGDSASGVPFKNEYSEELHNYRGALGMANAAPDQNKSQFYVVQGGAITEEIINAMSAAGYPQGVIDAYREVGGQPTLDYNYTVFGHVYDGLDVIDAINAVKVREDNRPEEDIVIKSITIDTYKNPTATE